MRDPLGRCGNRAQAVQLHAARLRTTLHARQGPPVKVDTSWRGALNKKIVVAAMLCAVVALVACRREVPYYGPLKLGADVPSAEHAVQE